LVDEDKALEAVDGAADAAASETPAETVAPAPRKPRARAWLGYLLLFLILMLVVGGYFFINQLRSAQEGLGGQLSKGDQRLVDMARQITDLQSEFATLHSQFATLQSQLTTEDTKFERQMGEQAAQINDKLNQMRSELETSVRHIQRQLGKTRGDLMIADAEYLLSVANQKLHLVGDVRSALAALEAADQRLRDSGDPGVFKAREALAEEIHLVKNLEPPDVVGISAKLIALEAKVKELPSFLPHAGHKSGEPGEQGQAEESGGVLENLKDLVTVRRTDRPVGAVLLPEEVEALRQVLLLKLEVSRLALLRADEALYKASLQSAHDWLTEHFDRDASVTQAVASELGALIGSPIRIEFPDISKSLALLHNIDKLRLEAEKAEGTLDGTTGAQP
jgi:uncharacterized protein HemX